MNRPPRNVVSRIGRPGALLRLLALAVLLSLPGCGAGGTNSEEDHGKHVDPPHKPATFAMAVQEVEHRFDELARPLASDIRTNRLVELDDILRWLPQMAGDTDLRRADWDEVNGLTARLVALRTAQPADATFASSLVNQVRPLTSRLGELAAKDTPAQGTSHTTPEAPSSVGTTP